MANFSKYSFTIIVIIGFLVFQIVNFGESDWTNQVFALIPPQVTPSPVAFLNNPTTSITITWTPVDATPPVTSYIVSRSVNGSPVSQLATNVVGTSFIDSNLPASGSTVAYRVRAVNSDGNGVQSSLSNEITILSGSITIIDDTIPNGPQNFGFAITGGLLPANFGLDDDSDVRLFNTRTYTSVLPGIYTVTENPVVIFVLTNLVCSDPDNGTTINLVTRAAIIDLDAGESITCTFTNTVN